MMKYISLALSALVGTTLLQRGQASNATYPTVRTGHLMKYLEDHHPDLEMSWEPFTYNGIQAGHRLSVEQTTWNHYQDLARTSGKLGSDAFDHSRIPTAAGNLTAVSKRASWDEVRCFGSGSWARVETLAFAKTYGCKALSFSVAAGSVQVLNWRTDPESGVQLLNEGGDPMSYYQTFRTLVGYLGNVSPVGAAGIVEWQCEAIVTKLIEDDCQGKNKDTRGGTEEIRDDKGKIVAEMVGDPQTDNCNC